MPRLLSAALTFEKNRLDSEHVLSLLAQVDIAGVGTPYRVANYDQDITFHGLTFVRRPMDVDALEDPTSLALSRLRLTIANVDQEFQAILENYWHPDTPFTVTIWYPVDMLAPNEMPFGAGDVYTVAQVATDLTSAVVDLQAAGLTLTGTRPKRRFTKTSGFPNIVRRVG
jgi:hypothetical protein